MPGMNDAFIASHQRMNWMYIFNIKSKSFDIKNRFILDNIDIDINVVILGQF